MLLAILTVFATHASFAQSAEDASEQRASSSLSRFGTVFNDNCAVCHGENMQGAAQGTPLVAVDLIHGDSMNVLIDGITRGYPETVTAALQGLEFNTRSRLLWGTEHGPRGGDEVNLLLRGRNYGWPLYSKGQNYNGTQVAWGKEFGIEFELKDIEQPVVDLTPSPAVSSLFFMRVTHFPPGVTTSS